MKMNIEDSLSMDLIWNEETQQYESTQEKIDETITLAKPMGAERRPEA